MARSRKMSRESKEGSAPTSNVVFLHSISSTSIADGKKEIHEEFIIHGDKGLSFKYYHKDEKGVERFSGHQNADGTFNITVMSGEKKEQKTVTKEELLKEIGKNKSLKFAVDYLKKQKGGSRKRSRKGSKRSSKRSSRK